MSNITPEFAKNTYTVEMADDINRLNNVTSILEKIQQDNGLTDETIKSANIAYDESQSILKRYNITTGEAIENQNTLRMYIDIFNVVNQDILDYLLLTNIEWGPNYFNDMAEYAKLKNIKSKATEHEARQLKYPTRYFSRS